MKRTNFKITAFVCLLALLFSLNSAIGGKRFITARYKVTGMGSCFLPESLPEGCTSVNTGTLCTSSNKTYYQDVCVTPYYRMP